ncbi:MAG TPA: dihydroorotase, partial [Planctomicrobium sp.]|nr:dihydroorotase [Planctomicrobium sp.]
MAHRTLITGASVVLPDGMQTISVLIEGERILALNPASTARVDETVHADGLHLIPGVIDDQVHFRDPGLEHKEDLHTGSLAC